MADTSKASAAPGDVELFRDDGLNRLLGKLRLTPRGFVGRLLYTAVPILIAWVPLFIYCSLEDRFFGPSARESLALDIAAWAQFFFSLPMFLLAEEFIDSRARRAGVHLSQSGIVEDPEQLRLATASMTRLRRRVLPDLVCLVIAYTMAWTMLHNELTAAGAQLTWRTLADAGGSPRLSAAGWWYGIVALPLFSFVWLRWVWKVLLWTNFMRHLGRMELRLSASHPDKVGGLAFLAEMQTSFGIIIFAFGVMVATTVIYKVRIAGEALTTFNAWGIAAGFVVFAPALFIAPMLLFTGRLQAVKRMALMRYASFATAMLSKFEGRYPARRREIDSIEHLTCEAPGVEDLSILYEYVKDMRLMPLDLKSMLSLAATAAGPMLPLLPNLVPGLGLEGLF